MGYQYVQPTDEQVEKMQVFRDKFEALQKEIDVLIPSSRGKSSCFTKLEEASFWLNKAITECSQTTLND